MCPRETAQTDASAGENTMWLLSPSETSKPGVLGWFLFSFNPDRNNELALSAGSSHHIFLSRHPQETLAVGIYSSHVQIVLDSWWFNLWFFIFRMVGKWYLSSISQTLNFHFFWGWQYAVRSFLMILGGGLEPQLPIRHMIKGGKWPIHLQLFCFPLLVQYSINYMIYLMLSYKMG